MNKPRWESSPRPTDLGEETNQTAGHEDDGFRLSPPGSELDDDFDLGSFCSGAGDQALPRLVPHDDASDADADDPRTVDVEGELEFEDPRAGEGGALLLTADAGSGNILMPGLECRG